MEIKTTVRYYHIPVRIAVIKKNVDENGEKLEFLYTVVGMKNGAITTKAVQQFLFIRFSFLFQSGQHNVF